MSREIRSDAAGRIAPPKNINITIGTSRWRGGSGPFPCSRKDTNNARGLAMAITMGSQHRRRAALTSSRSSSTSLGESFLSPIDLKPSHQRIGAF
jgi:hypothetical protein